MEVSTDEVVRERNYPFRFNEKTGNRIGDLYNFLIFSSLLLSFECVAMAFVSCIIQQVSWSAMTAIIPFLVAFSIYNLNRKTDEDEDAINRQDRFAFTKRYEKPLYYGGILALLLALAFSAMYGVLPLLATTAPFILGIMYSFRCLPAWTGYSRLKEIPAVKNIAVGISWAVICSLLPVYLSAGIPDFKTALVFVLFFMWGFMASLIPDMRDRIGDASAGVRTIPVIFGEEKAKTILSRVILLLGTPLIVLSLILSLPLFATALLVAANLYSHGCVYLLDQAHMRDFLADAISDGQYICFSLAILVLVPLYQVI
nr:UbiA family prenyltransferase [uncultured Methanoregula sp.]